METAKLATDAVSTAAILNGAVTTQKILDGAVNTAKLATDAVTTLKILGGAVQTSKLAVDAVTTTAILNLSVITAKLADGAVDTAKLAADSVTTVKILNGAVNTNKISPGSVNTSKMIGEAASNLKLLQSRGVANPQWVGAPYLIGSSIGNVSVTNTAVETALFTFAVPANTFGATNGVRVIVYGTYLNNSSSNQTLTLRMRETNTAGTIICALGGMTNVAVSTAVRFFRMVLEARNFNATNAQRCVMTYEMSTTSAIPAAGNERVVTSVQSAAAAAMDNRNLLVTATWSAAATSLNITAMVGQATFQP